MGATLTPQATARAAGEPQDMIDLRPGEERVVVIDCVPLLRAGELLESALPGQVVPPDGPRVLAARARQGQFVEVTLRVPAAAPARAWRDHALTVPLRTTGKQRLVAALTLRVHKG